MKVFYCVKTMNNTYDRNCWLVSLHEYFSNFCKQFGGLHTSTHVTQILLSVSLASGVPRNFVREGVQQIQLRTEDRENGDLGAVAP